jgi:hypothetical protein
MRRRRARSCSPTTVLRLVVVVLGCLALARPVQADAFDLYTNRVLTKLVESKNVKEVKQLPTNSLIDHDRVLPGIPSAFLVVKTNGGRHAKLLVQAGKQKVDAGRALPILLIERYVTYKEGEERTVVAGGKNLSLYPGFRLSLDLGQVVPEVMGGDLRFVAEGDKVLVEPVGKARLFLVTKGLELAPKKGAKFVMGGRFEPRYFNGTFQLFDDGRRSGRLTLEVDAEGNVGGSYYSDKDGAKYAVKGKVGNPNHTIEFRIRFPRVEQTFKGMLFTGNGQALAGTSRMVERDAAFYAVRIEE